MTRAIVTPCAYTVLCPKCREPLSNRDNGSQVWEDWHIEGVVACGCGATVTLKTPKKFAVVA